MLKEEINLIKQIKIRLKSIWNIIKSLCLLLLYYDLQLYTIRNYFIQNYK